MTLNLETLISDLNANVTEAALCEVSQMAADVSFDYRSSGIVNGVRLQMVAYDQLS